MEDTNQSQFQLPSAGIVHCRPELPDDEAFLRAVYASSREEELDQVNWNPGVREAFVDFPVKGEADRLSLPVYPRLIYREPAGRPAGRPGWCSEPDTEKVAIHLVDIALLSEFRGAGHRQFLFENAGDRGGFEAQSAPAPCVQGFATLAAV